MTEEENLFLKIGESLIGAEKSQLFGKPCFKIHGKAFICFFQNEMVFKLNGESHNKALSLNGSSLFDPSGKNRPMKEWVQISADNATEWTEMAIEAMKYVNKK